jgi:hypothetical protein
VFGHLLADPNVRITAVLLNAQTLARNSFVAHGVCRVSEAAYAWEGEAHRAKVSGKAHPLANVVVGRTKHTRRVAFSGGRGSV